MKAIIYIRYGSPDVLEMKLEDVSPKNEKCLVQGRATLMMTMMIVYAPASEYILALKITAGRQKDLEDCAILLPKTKIHTREQAQQVLDRYILPEGQLKNAESIENALNQLFGEG